jgi:hypothetical protein
MKEIKLMSGRVFSEAALEQKPKAFLVEALFEEWEQRNALDEQLQTQSDQLQGSQERLSEQTDTIREANKILAGKKAAVEKILAIVRFEITTRFPTAEAVRYDASNGSAVYPPKSAEEMRLREFQYLLDEFIGNDSELITTMYASPKPKEKWSV